MPEARPSSKRHQKIEPLSWEVAAQSPALKGMTSFLDISPDDVRRNNFEGFGPLRLTKVPRVAVVAPTIVVDPGDETLPGTQTRYDNVSSKLQKTKPFELPSGRGTLAPGLKETAADLAIPVAETSPNNEIDATAVVVPAIESTSALYMWPEVVSFPGVETLPVNEQSGGDEQNLARQEALTPGRGRSKIRRCVLAQDGHSLGEEAIYQVLWRTGRAENSDPNGSRTNRMGAADIGYKVNMAKKNVRQNISRLFEKLALEIVEDFETINSQARLYRVYSYKQILERRRAAGLEYILRNKGVVFCTKDGSELVSSPAYVSIPGDEISIKPAPPKKRRTVSPVEPPKYPHAAPTTAPIGASDEADVRAVSQALNRYWTVDEAAAVQLLRACRKVRADARVDEIAFFVQEKLDLARTSRTITNPTGLILAMVPQSFSGAAFEDFRKRMESRAKLAEEEAERKTQQEAELNTWMMRDRERYEAIVGDASKSDRERDEAEKRLREIDAWNR
ncbi:hypothetical protein [Granulicella arctica]|uniref:hypothetical protein n=1 Tax=Granulicella arctica TaxID=940613 RepID=UPI0021E06062|nr:hypothetical protein [Granulicella arctica]